MKKAGKRGITYGLVVALLTGATLVLYVLNPAQTNIFPPCPFHLITGLYCPGCGSLRGLHALLHGQLSVALSMNPLMLASLPVLAVMALNPRWVHQRWVPWTTMAVLVGYGVIRNIPLWPCNLLAP